MARFTETPQPVIPDMDRLLYHLKEASDLMNKVNLQLSPQGQWERTDTDRVILMVCDLMITISRRTKRSIQNN